MLQLVFLCLMLVLACCPACAQGIAVDSRKQLFLDDHLIESSTRVLRRTQQAIKLSSNPVLTATEPYEQNMLQLYGSVLLENGIYRMWYHTPVGVGYAESKDGLHWTKPRLDVVKLDGKPTNLVYHRDLTPSILPHWIELFGVVRDDREPDPAKRYKLGYLSVQRNSSGDPFHSGQRRGLGTAVSPDGIHWKPADPWASEAICDGQTTWMFDPASGRYVLYGRTRKTLPEVEAAWSKYDWYDKWHWGRAVARIESTDFLKWNFHRPDSAPVVMTAEASDEPGTEIYSIMVFPYESVYVGLVQVFMARPDSACLDLRLAVSRDSVHLTRVSDWRPFVELGGVGEWDRFCLSAANNQPFRIGDKLRFYYAGGAYRHPPYDGPDKGAMVSSIGAAEIQLDRFAALESSYAGGVLVTKPLLLKNPKLHLNVMSPCGKVVVEALVGGKVTAVSKPISLDSLDAGVEWQTGRLPGPSAPVTLRISLENARLFSLWTE